MKDETPGPFTIPKRLGRRLLRAMGLVEGRAAVGASGKMGRPRAPVLDEDYLERLRSQLGHEVYTELARDAAIEIADRLEELDGLVAAGDRQGVARVAHDLIAIAGHLGLSALSAAAADMNRAAREPGGVPLPAAVAPVRDLSEPSLEALRSYTSRPENA